MSAKVWPPVASFPVPFFSSDVIGPGAGYVAPKHEDDSDEEAPAVSVSRTREGWAPTLTDRQDEVDAIVLAILGPDFVPPKHGQHVSLARTSRARADDPPFRSSTQTGDLVLLGVVPLLVA